MASRDMIVIGASAGGVEALSGLVAGLDPSLPAAIALVVHVRPDATSALPAILARRGPLPASHAVDGERWERGRIYVAPPDHHLLIAGDRLRVTRGPRVNGHRPAVDPLFRSAARELGPRAIGVVLSGLLDDGTAGMMAIARAGGITLVQSPEDALHPSMPASVLEHVKVDHARPAAALGALLGQLSGGEAPDPPAAPPRPADPLELEESNEKATSGPPTMWTCPECGGSLWERGASTALEYRCHVGHAWGAESLAYAQDDRVEDAMWTAYRILEENAALSRRLAERAERSDNGPLARRYWRRHDEARARAALIHRVLERGALSSGEP